MTARRRIALMDINLKNRHADMPYMVEKKAGKGRFVISQVLINPKYEKNTRIYSRLLANMGATVHSDILSYVKCDRDYSFDYFMTLPHEPYNDYKKAEAYYSDRNYTLNNLGEGLYGWMKKLEKDVDEGFINIMNSAGRIYFLTCFVELTEDRCKETGRVDNLECNIEMDINCPFKLWVNSELKTEIKKENGIEVKYLIDDVLLLSGLNRLTVAAYAGDKDIRLRPVFKSRDGSYINNIRYRLTVDEIIPE